MTVRTLLVTGLFVLVSLGEALEAQCPQLRLRTWHRGGGETWSDSADGVRVASGQDAHVYFHVRGDGSQLYTTDARLGYPQEFGASGRREDVLEHVRMVDPSAEDVREGRIRFTAQAPGTTSIGYRVVGVDTPGRIGLLPAGCREGTFPVEILPEDARPVSEPGTRNPAARQLVERLYTALLRRESARTVHDDYVETVERRGQEGLVEVSRQILSSEEFRQQALARTEEVHGRTARPADLRERLLADVYRDLYGYVEPVRNDREKDLGNLDICLSGSVGAKRACEALGEDLVRRRLFYDSHRELIEELPTRRRRAG